jgi:hypothetical protein
MRFTALLGCVVLVAACSTKDSTPAADSAADTAAATTSTLPGRSLGSIAAIWNVTVKPEGKDSVATTYILNTTDTTGWMFAFPGGKPNKMRVTEIRGDTLMTETDWFESNVRKGLMARSTSVTWIQDGKMVGKTTVHYKTTGSDTVRVFDTEGIRQ